MRVGGSRSQALMKFNTVILVPDINCLFWKISMSLPKSYTVIITISLVVTSVICMTVGIQKACCTIVVICHVSIHPHHTHTHNVMLSTHQCGTGPVLFADAEV